MRFISPLLGILAIIFGAFALRGPTDIQLGIGCTAVIGGIILVVLGAVLSGQASILLEIEQLRAERIRQAQMTNAAESVRP